jgi:sugar lactone lactonase YvrE
MDLPTTTIAAAFAFPEGPRWHDGLFWFSDQHDSVVHVLTAEGAEVESFMVPGRPSGLGWLPGGDLLIASMQERRLYRRHAGALKPYADLAAIHPGYSNDMVVDDQGRAYVGNIGFDFEKGESFRPTAMALVSPDGRVAVAADGLDCPNGTVITPDGRFLIVGESMGHRLTRFAIAPDGGLSDRQVFAELGEHVPDGICLDAEGCVWVASPFGGAVIRVREGGEIVDRAPVEAAGAYACMLGGEDGRTLFICCATDHDPRVTVKDHTGRIDIARAPAPGAGWP